MRTRATTSLISIVVLSLLLPAGPAAAAINVDVTQMLINISNQLGPVQKAITGAVYVIGLGLFFKGMYHLKIYGELRTMMASQTSLKQPLSYMVIGAVFIYLPTAVSIMLNSTFGDPSLTPFDQWVGAKTHAYGTAMIAIFRIVQVVGMIAFLRGWVLLVKTAQQGGQGGFAKGITHIVGGIAALNIVGTANLLSATLGVNFGF